MITEKQLKKAAPVLAGNLLLAIFFMANQNQQDPQPDKHGYELIIPMEAQPITANDTCPLDPTIDKIDQECQEAIERTKQSLRESHLGVTAVTPTSVAPIEHRSVIMQ